MIETRYVVEVWRPSVPSRHLNFGTAAHWESCMTFPSEEEARSAIRDWTREGKTYRVVRKTSEVLPERKKPLRARDFEVWIDDDWRRPIGVRRHSRIPSAILAKVSKQYSFLVFPQGEWRRART